MPITVEWNYKNKLQTDTIMSPVKIKSKTNLLMLVLVVFQSFHATSQKNDSITIYDSPEKMVAAAKEIITEIAVSEFRNIYTNNDLFIIDVRTAEEFKDGAVPGAVNIPRGVLEFRVGKKEIWESAHKNQPDKDDSIVVYCRTGGRAALSAKALMQLGYKNVKSVEGGWVAWQESRNQQ